MICCDMLFHFKGYLLLLYNKGKWCLILLIQSHISLERLKLVKDLLINQICLKVTWVLIFPF